MSKNKKTHNSYISTITRLAVRVRLAVVRVLRQLIMSSIPEVVLQKLSLASLLVTPLSSVGLRSPQGFNAVPPEIMEKFR